jgi:hypothetical protein
MASPTILGKATAVGNGGVNFTNASYDVAPVAGNLLVAFIGGNGYAYSFDNPALSDFPAPVGWTRLQFIVNGGLYAGAIFYKIATGSDNVSFAGISGDGAPETAGVIVSIDNGSTPSSNLIDAGTVSSVTSTSIGGTSDLLLVSNFQIFSSNVGTIVSVPSGMTNVALANSYGTTADTTVVRVSSLVPQGTPTTHTSSTFALNLISSVAVSYSGGTTTSAIGWGFIV